MRIYSEKLVAFSSSDHLRLRCTYSNARKVGISVCLTTHLGIVRIYTSKEPRRGELCST